MTRLALVVLVAGAACSELEPDVGPLLAGRCDDSDANPGVSVSFARDIQPLISRDDGGCSCHVQGGVGTQVGGLDLSSLSTLRAGGRNSGSRIVVPMQPCASILYEKVDRAPPFGSRMPLGGPFLTAEEVGLIHDWIAEGGLDN